MPENENLKTTDPRDVPEDGGPAFPSAQPECLDGTWNQTFQWGLSIRDYFAGEALKGLCSNLSYDFIAEIGNGERGGIHMVKAAFYLADAMLEARKK